MRRRVNGAPLLFKNEPPISADRPAARGRLQPTVSGGSRPSTVPLTTGLWRPAREARADLRHRALPLRPDSQDMVDDCVKGLP